MKTAICLHIALAISTFCLSSGTNIYPEKIKKSMSNFVIDNQLPVTETFDQFFRKFKSSPSFQFSRTVFPLRIVSNSDDGNTIKLVNKKDWRFTNFAKIKKLVATKSIISKDKVDMSLSIEDTGIQITYHLENRRGSWWLTSVTDESD